MSLAHSVSSSSDVWSSRAISVSVYSTLGGTTGWTVRMSKPSRSSLRRVSVSMRLLIPLIERSSSVNRTGPDP